MVVFQINRCIQPAPFRTRRRSDPLRSSGNLEGEDFSLAVLSAAGRALSNPALEAGQEQCSRVNELHLSEQELQDYNLKQGSNEAVFSVTTQFQGKMPNTGCLDVDPVGSAFIWDRGSVSGGIKCREKQSSINRVFFS